MRQFKASLSTEIGAPGSLKINIPDESVQFRSKEINEKSKLNDPSFGAKSVGNFPAQNLNVGKFPAKMPCV